MINRKIIVRGIVQGVGFRPFVWRIARENGIRGTVKNTSSGVVIKACAEPDKIKSFLEALSSKKPPQARIDSVKVSAVPPGKYPDFKILKSSSNKKNEAAVPADLAMCPDCAAETSDPADRRYLYPFTNCTNCGPRFSIIRKIPYDRPNTTMKNFKMCSACLAEYENPADRRFHAQPNACPVCGPRLWLEIKGRVAPAADPLDAAASIILKGGLIALKGLGGFHLACDALNPSAVKKLRKFKDRPYKPFAVMTASAKAAEKWLEISEPEKELLFSPAAPIVMLKKKKPDFLNLAAPRLSSAGLMLPYTPLHQSLFLKLAAAGFKNPLIMTSGNFRDEPIVKDNEKAREVFRSFDAVLFHDRPIHNRVDDSVCFVDASGKTRLIRRARGYVPESIRIGLKSSLKALSGGADIKNCFALLRGREVFLSQHIGDLDEKLNRDFYLETISNMETLLGIKPETVIADLHPDYRSSRLCGEMPGRHSYVQHHLAHILSVMAEKGLKSETLGVSFDGTGYGPDGKIWGGEFFVLKKGKAFRQAHLRYFPLPGGDACVSEIWRSLLSLSLSSGINPGRVKKILSKKIKRGDFKVVSRMVLTGVNSPLSSSMGRLFDAFACLIKKEPRVTYEAQAAMELESLVNKMPADFYKFELSHSGGLYLINPAQALAECLDDAERGLEPGFMAGKFHFGIVQVTLEILEILRKKTGISTVCLSGGVFQNRILTDWLSEMLERKKFLFYFNEKVPSNDGGLALGQIYAALLKMNNPV